MKPSIMARSPIIHDDPTPLGSASSTRKPARARVRQRIPKSCLPCLSGKRACDRGKPICSRCMRTHHQCVYAEEPLPEPRMARLPRDLVSSEEDAYEAAERGRGEAAEKRRKVLYGSGLADGNGLHSTTSTNPPSHPSSHVAGAAEEWTDSDVHRAGQALVNLQGSTPWSVSTDAASPSVSRLSTGHSSRHAFATGTAASMRSSSSTATPSKLRDEDAGSHVNLNGQPLWHGETVTGTSVFNQVPSGDEPNDMHTTSDMPTNIQSAFNGLLYPMADSFPFETIWSSGANFKQEVMPLFPSPKDGKGIIDAFKRFVRVASPGLLDSSMITPAENFLCYRPERERELVSLPWMASFFMMVAIGQESQRACGPGADEEEGEDMEREGAEFDEAPDHQKARRTAGKGVADTRRRCDLLLSATYQALRLCSFLGSPNLQTIYAQLLIGIYLLHTERASNAWPILGSITRQAQSIGLHVEPSSIRGCATIEERELRRRLWWTIVQQDVLLSSIFGRPLAVSRFTCRVTQSGNSLERIERQPSYQEILCEFSIFARRHLNEDQEQEWSEVQLKQFKDDLLSWYSGLPSQMTLIQAPTPPEDGRLRTVGNAEKQWLRDQLSRRGAITIQHAVDLDLQVQFALLSLYRNRLVTGTHRDGYQHRGLHGRLNEQSLFECGRYVHGIALAMSALADLLGTLQAGMVWVRVFYAFHAGVTAAYLALSRSTSPLGARAREDLTTLTEICQRLPDRFDGLKTVKATFGVLSRLVQVHSEQQQRRTTAGSTSDHPVNANAMLGAAKTSPARDVRARPTTGGEAAPHVAADDRILLGEQAGTGFSPLQLDELLTANNMGLPAFNLSRDPPVSGLAPFFDQPYMQSAPSGEGSMLGLSAPTTSDNRGQSTGYDGHSTAVAETGESMQGLSNSAHPQLPSISASFDGGPQPSNSRPDRGFPEPFGPMIAPPGPDASTSEIVTFWREFFALPFEASDMGLV